MTRSNPFATRFIRPGAIEYIFPPGQSAESLVAALRENQWVGEIVGPHGSGKSTLVAALVPELKRAGRNVIRYVITPDAENRTGCLAPPGAFAVLSRLPLEQDTQLILDGFERISWWWRRRIQVHCRRRRAGLLVTAHQSVGLPLLVETRPTKQLAQQIVERLVPAGDSTISPADVQAAFARCDRNLRETLFALFDVYQSRQI
jgi:energy-coupling factor transporter ATP-binding protein EcfA2